METKRNLANVGRKTAMPGQNLQHFMSNSPWSGPTLIIVYPLTQKRGVPSKNPVIAGNLLEVQAIEQQATLSWETIRLRPNERGFLDAQFARCRVWVAYPGPELRQEWLLIRKDLTQITYVLSNAPEIISLEQMAWRKSQRYLIERSHQDAKEVLPQLSVGNVRELLRAALPLPQLSSEEAAQLGVQFSGKVKLVHQSDRLRLPFAYFDHAISLY